MTHTLRVLVGCAGAAICAIGCVPDLSALSAGEDGTSSSAAAGSGGKGQTGGGGRGATASGASVSGSVGSGGQGATGDGAAAGSGGNATTGSGGKGATSASASSGSGGAPTCTIPDPGLQPSAPALSPSWTFDSGLQGWGSVGVTSAFDGTDGSPTAGSAELTIPFSTDKTTQEFLFTQILAAPVDVTGKIISARVRLTSCNPTGSVKAFIILKSTTTYIYARSGYTVLSLASGWVTLMFDPAKPGYVDMTNAVKQDLTDVVEFDIAISAGITPSPIDATVDVDTVGLSVDSTSSSAGSGGASATSSSSAGSGGAAASAGTGGATAGTGGATAGTGGAAASTGTGGAGGTG